MSNIRKRTSSGRQKTDDERMLEITEELMGGREPLDFASYQRQVAELTPNWPIENADYMMEKISILAANAVGKDKFEVALQAALILRAIAEISDYIPMPMERLAHIGLSGMGSKTIEKT